MAYEERLSFILPINKDFNKSLVDTAFHKSIADLYKYRIGALIKFAERHVYRSDLAIDAVHDALAKSVAYFQKHPAKKVSERIIQFLIIRSCKKINRTSKEISVGEISYLVDSRMNDDGRNRPHGSYDDAE